MINKYFNLCIIYMLLNMPSALAVSNTWDYGVGSLQDNIFNEKIQFTLSNGSVLTPLPAGAVRGFIIGEEVTEPYLFSLKNGQEMHTALPIKMYVEWVSYVDKKRYGVTVSLPNQLDKLNQNCKGWLTLSAGVAPNGYFEVYLLDVCKKNDVLITRGIAPEIQGPWDNKFPLKDQFKKAFANFDKYYTPLIKKYPIPYWRFSLDQPPIVSTYPDNVWGNRKPSKEWLARMEAEKQANAPAPPPQNRCWANKKPELTKSIQLDKSSPQYALQRIFWEYSPDLLQQVYKVGNDADAAILEAWDEAKKQNFDEDQSQLWVIARLVGLTNYPIETIIKQLKVKPKGIQPLKQYLANMCNKQAI